MIWIFLQLFRAHINQESDIQFLSEHSWRSKQKIIVLMLSLFFDMLPLRWWLIKYRLFPFRASGGVFTGLASLAGLAATAVSMLGNGAELNCDDFIRPLSRLLV